MDLIKRTYPESIKNILDKRIKPKDEDDMIQQRKLQYTSEIK